MEAVLGQRLFSTIPPLILLYHFPFFCQCHLTHTMTAMTTTSMPLLGCQASRLHFTTLHLLCPKDPQKLEPPQIVTTFSTLIAWRTSSPHQPASFKLSLPCHSQGDNQCCLARNHSLPFCMHRRHVLPLSCAYCTPCPRGRPPPMRWSHTCVPPQAHLAHATGGHPHLRKTPFILNAINFLFNESFLFACK